MALEGVPLCEGEHYLNFGRCKPVEATKELWADGGHR
jgi:hypothetical protein